jgi:hypothetical protein
MKISNISAYFINPDDYKHRLKGIQDVLDVSGFKSVTRVAFNEKFKGKNITMTKAHLALIDRAVEDNAFPFALFEDDARMIKSLPEEFNIPQEAELVYLGGSNYCCGAIPNLYIKEYNNDFYRVYYMLSAHAILVPDMRGVNIIRETYNKAVEKSGYNDMMLAKASDSHVFLVPKDGNYFYQDDYTRDVTDFLWKDEKIQKRFLKK